jgi:hypothetical protein
MARKSMVKLMLVMMKLIIFIILKVHANEHSILSSSSTLTLPPTSLHPFHLDNENMNHIHLCLESTIEECEKILLKMMCIGHLLFECLFKDPMHHKDHPIKLDDIRFKCIHHCRLEFETDYLGYAACLVNQYEKHIKKD